MGEWGWGRRFPWQPGNTPWQYSKWKNEQGVEGERNGEVETSQEKIKTGGLKAPEIAQKVAHMHPTHGCILDQVFVFNCTHLSGCTDIAIQYIMLLYIVAVRHKPQMSKAATYHERGEINKYRQS